MPINGYGVWVGYLVDYTVERANVDSKSPHVHLSYSNNPDLSGDAFTAAINVKSVSKESRLVYWSYQNYEHPITQFLESLGNGFHALPTLKKQGLDYIRGNLLIPKNGMLVEHDVPGSNNDILDYVTPTLDRAKAEGAKVYLFGQQYSDRTGIHDIHMNQGNEGKFKNDNGVFQDGGVIFQFPDGRFTAVFIAFAIQKVHTDDATGNALGSLDFAHYLARGPALSVPIDNGHDGGSQPTEGGVLANDDLVVIKAALVNPVGPDRVAEGRPETVRLYNGSNVVASLDGWGLINSHGDRQELDGSLQPFQDKGVLVPDCPLSNKGDTITLLDSAGLKVDGVKYTAREAKREGRFLLFHS